MDVNPAAGPLTLILEPLKYPTTIPPITPAIIPENGGAPEATATPKQSGNATKKTTIDAEKSLRKVFLFINEEILHSNKEN